MSMQQTSHSQQSVQNHFQTLQQKSNLHGSFSGTRKNSIKEAISQQNQMPTASGDMGTQPRVKSLIPKPAPRHSLGTNQSRHAQNSNFMTNAQIISQNNLQTQKITASFNQSSSNNNNHHNQLTPDPVSRTRQQFSQTLLPSQMLTYQLPAQQNQAVIKSMKQSTNTSNLKPNMYQGVSSSSCGNRNSSVGLTNSGSKNQSRGNSANMKNLNLSTNKTTLFQPEIKPTSSIIIASTNYSNQQSAQRYSKIGKQLSKALNTFDGRTQQNQSQTDRQSITPIQAKNNLDFNNIPSQLNRLQESIQRNTTKDNLKSFNSHKNTGNGLPVTEYSENHLNNNFSEAMNTKSNSNFGEKAYLSNRTSCYDREEMDEKYVDDPNQNDSFKNINSSNQHTMLMEITNSKYNEDQKNLIVLKQSNNSRVSQKSQVQSRQTNDYSITQFNMNSLNTPNVNDTIMHTGNFKQLPHPHIDVSQVTHVQCPPSVMSMGEENISNEESPHKCHSIKTYHISTFFNKENQQKFIEFIENRCISQKINYEYLRTYPKMNFQLPESKFHENMSISQYETPINISIPYNLDCTQNQDVSILTNSQLNITNTDLGGTQNLNSASVGGTGDFGQNNQKKMQNFSCPPQSQQQSISSGGGGGHIKIQNCYSVSENDNSIDLIDNPAPPKQSQNVEIHKQHLIQTFNALQTIPLLGPYQKHHLKKERIYLPPPRNPSHKKVLILDIDETMIHCLDERDPENEEPDVVIRIPLDDEGDYADAGINIRPHLYECLKQINEYYQVITFTASDQQYANAILDFIDPNQSLIQYRLYRQHCIETEFGYIKDLRIIANRDLQDMVLVDNSVLSFAMQIENGIPILPFYVNKQDEELLHLIYYLKCLVVQEDVRPHNREAFGLNKLAQMDLQQIIRNTTVDPAINESLGGTSSHSSNTAADRDESQSDSMEGLLSPSAKINDVKQKYFPNDMDQINEESIESDMTSSMMSKKLISINQHKYGKASKQQKSIHASKDSSSNASSNAYDIFVATQQQKYDSYNYANGQKRISK